MLHCPNIAVLVYDGITDTGIISDFNVAYDVIAGIA